jgi:hypothetical protein
VLVRGLTQGIELIFFYYLHLSFTLFFSPRLSLVPAFQTIEKPVEDPSELPKWNYDGSSTGQAPGEDSEVIL